MYKKNHSSFRYLYFLKEIVMRDIKKKYYKSVLGMIWTILNPLLMMLVMTVVFSTLFKRNIANFPIYYMCGNLLFSFNSGSTNQALHTMVANNALLRKIYVPKYMFILSPIAVNFVTMLFSLISLVIVMVITGTPFTPYLFLIPVPIIYTLIFTTGLSLILGAYGVFFRDLNHLYGIFILVWTYSTPLFYPISIIPQKFLFIFELNPMYHFITILRDIVHLGTMPSEKSLIIASCYSIITLILGIVIFKEHEDKFYLHI